MSNAENIRGSVKILKYSLIAAALSMLFFFFVMPQYNDPKAKWEKYSKARNCQQIRATDFYRCDNVGVIEKPYNAR
jgi:hypothetical protein